MKTIHLIAAGAFSLILAAEASASLVTINDSYIGGGTTHHSWHGHDVIGEASKFDISKMEVELQGSKLSVSIYSTYFKNVGLLDTVLGDLFISTDGYSPFGTGGHLQDTAHTGEDWELAVTLDAHGGTIGDADGVQSFLGQSGVASLYTVNDDGIALTNVPQGIFRGEQETQYHATGQLAAAFGTWSIQDVVGSEYDSLTYVLDLGAFAPAAGTTLGLHWNMTCGNDTIEGGYTVPSSDVPEPGSAVLFSIAALLARRKRLSSLG